MSWAYCSSTSTRSSYSLCGTQKHFVTSTHCLSTEPGGKHEKTCQNSSNRNTGNSLASNSPKIPPNQGKPSRTAPKITLSQIPPNRNKRPVPKAPPAKQANKPSQDDDDEDKEEGEISSDDDAVGATSNAIKLVDYESISSEDD